MKKKASTVLLFACLLALRPAWSDTAAPAATRFVDGGRIVLTVGKHRVEAEIASSRQSRERGLMERENLCRDCGMLFVFDFAAGWRFWMKNTPMPLSIAFIAPDGSIINIEEMQPNTLDSHMARNNALYALEMNSGWFSGNGIEAGSRIRELAP